MNLKSLSAGLVVGVVLAVSAGAQAQDTPQSIYEAAKKEGKVVFWSAMDIVQIKRLGATFTKRYPGVQFEQFQIQPGPALERMVTETSAGRAPAADVFDTNLSYLPMLLERNMLEPYEWTRTFNIPPIQVLYDKKVIQFMNLDIPIAINTSMVKPGDIKSWEDLTDAKYRGKVIVEARGQAFAVLALGWGEDKAFDYLKRLMANKPIITKGGTPTLEALAGGQGAIAIGTYGGRLIQAREDNGAPVDWARVGPVPAMIYVLGVPKGTARPNAGRLFAAWMLTAEGQDALWDAMRYGMAVGDNLSKHGKDMKAARLDILLEGMDQKEAVRLIEKAGKQIGSLQ